MQKIFLTIFPLVIMLCLSASAYADVKIKQRMSMGGQKFESTRMIKGSRERTEQKIEMADPAAAAMFPQIATITQCDLRRTVRLNDRKQLYMVEPFATAEDTPAVNRAPAAKPANTTTRRGGTMTITYSFRDTGERKTIFGLQARRLIMTHEMETSADSCNGPNKTKMEFDGWYADFSADFSCPINVPPPSAPQAAGKPDCIDRIITKGSGAGIARTGFLLEGTMTMYGPDGKVQMTQTTETLELSRATLDAGLFDIPQSYKEAGSQQDLYAISMPGLGDIARMSNNRNANTNQPAASTAKSVAVNLTFGSGVKADQAEIQNYVKNKIRERGLNVASGGGDYTLNMQFRQIKESSAGKIGGIFGKVTGVDTGKLGKVDIDLTARLAGTTRESQVKSKFDGPLTDAIHAAIDQALDQLLDGID